MELCYQDSIRREKNAKHGSLNIFRKLSSMCTHTYENRQERVC